MSQFARTNTIAKSDQDTNAASTTTHAKIGTQDNARRWRLRKVLASYNNAAQAGTVTITGIAGAAADGSGAGTTAVTIVRDFVGSCDLNFGEAGLQGLPWTDLIVTVSAGAAAVVSNLTTIASPE